MTSDGNVPRQGRVLLGGNLSVFSRMLGTAFMPSLDGAILLLDRSKVRIQVEKKPAYAGIISFGVGWQGGAHSV